MESGHCSICDGGDCQARNQMSSCRSGRAAEARRHADGTKNVPAKVSSTPRDPHYCYSSSPRKGQRWRDERRMYSMQRRACAADAQAMPQYYSATVCRQPHAEKGHGTPAGARVTLGSEFSAPSQVMAYYWRFPACLWTRPNVAAPVSPT